jgi:putative oxidoreductase
MADMGSFYARWTPRFLSVLRIITAFLLMAHGAQKLFGFPAAPPPTPEQLAKQECEKKCAPPQQQPQPQQQGGMPPLMLVAGILEFFGGLLFLLGLLTRPVAFILSGLLAVAYFMSHAPGGFWPIINKGELAVLYCFVFLFFAVAGGGEWSVDRLFGRSRIG